MKNEIKVEFDTIREIAAKRLPLTNPSDELLNKVAIETESMLDMFYEIEQTAAGNEIDLDNIYFDERIVRSVIRRVYRIYKDGICDALTAATRAIQNI